jgi:hypothetical protein
MQTWALQHCAPLSVLAQINTAVQFLSVQDQDKNYLIQVTSPAS